MVRSKTVQFGTITQCGRSWAFVRTESGAEVRLYWNNLRLVESAHGGILFSTGKSPSVGKGDKVAFVPQKEGVWIWALRADYETARDFVERNPIPSAPLVVEQKPLVAPLPPPPPAPEINLEQEMTALGSERLQKWQRRYSGNRRAFA